MSMKPRSAAGASTKMGSDEPVPHLKFDIKPPHMNKLSELYNIVKAPKTPSNANHVHA